MSATSSRVFAWRRLVVTGVAIVVAFFVVSAAPASAATLTWSTTSGTWDLSALNWNPGPVAWTQTGTTSALNDAVFGGTDGTYAVTLAGSQIAASNLTFNASGYTLSGTSLFLGSGTATVASGKAATISSVVRGTVGLAKEGAGTLTLSGANTFSGGVRLTAGTLLVGNASALGANLVDINGGNIGSAAAATVNITSGSFRFSNDFTAPVDASGQLTLNAPMTLANGTRTITVSSGQGFNLYGGISDGGNGYGLMKTGAALLRLGGVNTYTGDTRVNQGTLTIWTNLAAQYSTLDTDGAGAFAFTGPAGGTTPTIGGFKGSKNQSIGNAVLSVSLNPAASVSNSYSGVLSGSTSIIMIGSGTQVFAGANTYTGTTDIRAGTLQIGNAGATGALSLSSAISGSAGGTLAFNRTDTVTQGTHFNAVVGGALNLAQLGSGTLVLNGTNTFTGTTSVNAGTLSFDRIDALATTAGVRIGSSAGLTYTGTAGTFGKNISVTSGTGTVRNTGGGTLALTGTLAKNGTVLRFNTGTFTVNGLITGASPNSDLVVDTATVTLTNSNNDYNGPTIVRNAGTLILGADNVIPAASAVTVDASTLAVGGYINAIQSLATAGNAAITISASGSSSGGLTMGNLTFGAGNDALGLTMTSATAGRYSLFTYTGTRSGTFDTVTGLNSSYNLVYGAASNSSIDLQMKASVGAVTTTVTSPTIIVGGTAGLSYTVANTTPSGGATLSFTSTNGTGVVGSSSGSALAGQTSGSVSGLGFVGNAVGLGQAGLFTVTDSAAIVQTGTGSFTVDVLNHSLASFATSDTATKTLDFGTYDPSSGLWSGGSGGNGTLGFALYNIASGGFTDAQTAGLDLYEWSLTGDAVFSPGLSTFTNLTSGSSSAFSASVLNPGSLAEGAYTATFTLKFRDQNLPGATNTRNLTLTTNVVVVPEPTAFILMTIGVAVAAGGARGLHRARAMPHA